MLAPPRPGAGGGADALPHAPRRREGRAPASSGERPSRPALRPRSAGGGDLPEPRSSARSRVDTGQRAGAAPAAPLIGLDRPGPRGRPALGAPAAAAAARSSRSGSAKRHVELVDSAVTAIVQAYLDSIANDPSARSAGLPSWTKEIAGKKFGIDSQEHLHRRASRFPPRCWRCCRSLRGNIDQNQAYNHLMDLRADLQYAAQRAANLDEFKAMIRDMRLQEGAGARVRAEPAHRAAAGRHRDAVTATRGAAAS